MNEYSEIFDEVGVLYVNNILTKEECDEALLYLFRLKEDEDHIDDTISGGFKYNFRRGELDYLLEKVKPTLEKILDKSLLPTYSFSRIYKENDYLLLHTDRNACEISMTITLGYGKGSIWPFKFLSKNDTKLYTNFKNDGSKYIGELIEEYDSNLESKCIIEVGDGVLYKGMEVAHGRGTYYHAKWQAQVFLHYVDANGPNAEHKNNKIDQMEQMKREIDNGTRS